MFRKVAEKLQTMVRPGPQFDPAQLGDPLAAQVAWTPVRRGGSNFRTHTLVRVHSDRYEFRSTLGAKLFYGVFIGMGLIVPVVVVLGIRHAEGQMPGGIFGIVLPILFGVVFAAVGAALMVTSGAPVVFDKHRGWFWRGRKAPYDVVNVNEIKNACNLEDIHALQLLSEWCRSDKSSYYSYELNLVLGDGTRLNVIDHGNKKAIREDAENLSAFLERPIWDAI